MKKENVRIKENITLADQIAVIDYIMDFYFTDGEYTPYYSGMARVEAIAKYFLEGITFDKEDIIYDCVVEDKEIYNLVKKFYLDQSDSKASKTINNNNKNYLSIMAFVIENVNEKLEFEKQKVIHCTDEKSDLIKNINLTLEAFVDLSKNIKYAAKPVIENPEFGKYALNVLKKFDAKDVINKDTLTDIVRDLVKEQGMK